MYGERKKICNIAKNLEIISINLYNYKFFYFKVDLKLTKKEKIAT
jgi:hypothetical protein